MAGGEVTGVLGPRSGAWHGRVEEVARLLVGAEQGLDAAAEVGVAGAGCLEVSGASAGSGFSNAATKIDSSLMALPRSWDQHESNESLAQSPGHLGAGIETAGACRRLIHERNPEVASNSRSEVIRPYDHPLVKETGTSPGRDSQTREWPNGRRFTWRSCHPRRYQGTRRSFR